MSVCCLRFDPCIGSNENELSGTYELLPGRAPDKLSTILSFPKSPNECGYTGRGYPGPPKGFPVRGPASYQVQVSVTSELHFPTSNGSDVLPGDAKDTVRFITGRGVPRIKEFWNSQPSKVGGTAGLLAPMSNKIRDSVDIDRFAARARLHIPLL